MVGDSVDFGEVDSASERWHPRRLIVVLGLVLLIFVVCVATGVVGVPMPGGLRRYSKSELEAVAAKIGTGCMSGPAFQATVDLGRSRVIANGGVRWDAELTFYEKGMVENPKLIACTPAIK